MDAYDRLKQLVAEAETDVLKGAGGNKAARVRARKKRQEIKEAAQDVRVALLEQGAGSDEAGEAAGSQ